MHWFTGLFLFFLALVTILRLYLAQRQIDSVREHRDEVPKPFAEDITLADHQKAADYSAARVRLGMLDTVVDTLLLLGWTIAGGLGLVLGFWGGLGLNAVVAGTAAGVSVFFIVSLLSLPLSAYSTFAIEARFGFNRTTLGTFLGDLVKGWLLMFLLGGPLIAAILWLMDQAGSKWWLYAWVVWTSFTLLLTWAYPTFIAPIFNKFTPLADEQLKQRIEQLMIRCGFRSKGIFVMDGSRRSSHGNAYFTGLGNNKRIVFFDTLINRLEPAEVEAVLAHELGHFRLNHVRKRMLLSMAIGLAGLALLGWLTLQPWFYSALGVAQASAAAALLLFIFVLPVFTFVFTPLGSWLSRRHEFEADAYAVAQSDASLLAVALVKLYRDNATTLTPDSLHSLFYDSHPPAPVRVARLQQIAGNA
ncbi:MAG: M48 family metallopeptidase [Gammaproteobacteria bacterium]|nr:M48 family metallopeptidase [Gammaproteobacteria bacterium]MCZ6761862.1 M48 family metallopeptidase [Gammaproteobacteria bacterium]MCZ6881227.1 M48 family metallopeptidase [Gammaproteobacteria bacterium]TDJ12393.1 MAG: M48 family peptidase [Gammaproteobacteria bacterium]